MKADIVLNDNISSQSLNSQCSTNVIAGKVEPENSFEMGKPAYYEEGSVDLEVALSSAGFGKFNYYLLFTAIVASFGWLAASCYVIANIACDFDLNGFEKGLLQVAPHIGMVLSGLFWGPISDTFGRQKLMTYSFFFGGMFGMAASLSPNFYLMTFFRVLEGIANCGSLSIFSTYLAETFLKKHRYLVVLSLGLFAGVGYMLQPALALLVMWYFPIEPQRVYDDYKITSWRLFLLGCVSPQIVCAIACMFTPESPKFLVEKGEMGKALEVCSQIFSINTGLPKSKFPVGNILEQRSSSEGPQRSSTELWWEKMISTMRLARLLFHRPYVNRVWYYFIIDFGASAVAIAFRLWLPEVYAITSSTQSSYTAMENPGMCDLLLNVNSTASTTGCEVTSSESYYNMIIINSGLLAIHPLNMIYSKYLGVKIPIVLSTLVPGLMTLVLPLLSSEYVVYLTAVLLSMLHVEFYSVMASVISIYPTEIRATSLIMVQTVGRLGTVIINFFVSAYIFSDCTTTVYCLGSLLLVSGLVSVVLPTSPLAPTEKLSREL